MAADPHDPALLERIRALTADLRPLDGHRTREETAALHELVEVAARVLRWVKIGEPPQDRALP